MTKDFTSHVTEEEKQMIGGGRRGRSRTRRPNSFDYGVRDVSMQLNLTHPQACALKTRLGLMHYCNMDDTARAQPRN